MTRAKGVRQSTDQRWPALLAAIRLLLAERVVSIRSLAERLRVSDRTLRRWLDGTDLPADDRIYGIDVVVEGLIVSAHPDEALPSPVIDRLRTPGPDRADRRRRGTRRHVGG